MPDLPHTYTDDPLLERARFAADVEALIAAGQPVKLNFGPGPVPRAGMLNIDIMRHVEGNPSIYVWPFLAAPLPIPDECVDYVFSEDFIEHIPQLEQVLFLAETRRVMKTGAWHRVNTPDLRTAMKANSDMSKGWSGVYQSEWLQWGHVAILTRYGLEELARMTGYGEVVFNGKGQGVGPYAESDYRPTTGRVEYIGNIFADLLK